MPPPARPVADAPVAALVSGADDVARDWLVELVGAAPLAAAAALPVDAIAARGPQLVAAIAHALASDAELARLQPGGDLRAVALAARAGDAASTLAATEALRRAIFTAALDAAHRASPAMVADLASRLSFVCSEVTAAALEASVVPDRLASLAAREHGAPPPPSRSVAAVLRDNGPREEAEAGEAPAPRDEARAPAPEAPPAEDAGEPAAPPPPAHAAPQPVRPVEPWAPEEVPKVVAGVPPIVRPPVAERPEPEPETPRVADGDPRTHLAARAADYLADGRPFAVLLVELDGIGALLEADGAEAVAAAETALEDLVRPGDAIRRETAGRLWLTLPGAGPAGARALALRAAAAVERAADHRGTPLTASVGVAVCPRDGTDPDELADVAETGLFAARAGGHGGAEPPAN